MQNIRYCTQEIKNKIKMPEILKFYGIHIDKNNRIPCPIHNGKDKNCGVKENYIHCFVCGESADQIGVVQKLFNLSFLDALKKIDVDFNLNIYGEHTFEELRRSHYQQKKIQAETERKKRQKEQADVEYWAVFDEWKRLDDNKRNYAPKTFDEEWHPLFVEALQKLAYQEYLLDCAKAVRK